MAKKPVPKRKGYADGGRVSENMISPDDQLGATYDRSAKTNEQTDRFLAARRAQTSANYNEMSPELQAKVLDNMRAFGVARTGSSKNPYTDKEFAQERANYPGFSKGGKVKKPMFEGSKKDIRQDKVGAKKLGVSMKAYENTARDKAQDKAGQRQMYGKRK